MNENLGMVGSILSFIGIGLCAGEEAFLGVLFIIVGILMILSSTSSSESKNDNSKNNESQNKSSVLLNSTNSNNNLTRTSGSSSTISYTKTNNEPKYKKYVRVRFNSSSKVYTYLSDPSYPLRTGEYVNINGNSRIERVYVVEGDTLMLEKTDMHYKVIPISYHKR